MNNKEMLSVMVTVLLFAFSSFAIPSVSAVSSEFSPSKSASYAVTVSSATGLLSTNAVNPRNQQTYSSESVKVLAKGQDEAQPMTLSGGYVYWYNLGNGELSRVNQSGGKVDVIATFNTSDGPVYGLAVVGNYVYTTIAAVVQKTDVTSGATKVIENGGPNFENYGLTASSKYIFFIENELSPRQYFIERMSLTGSDLTTLATDPSPIPYQVLYAGGYVYWYDLYTGQIGKVSQDGGIAQLLSPAFSPASTEGYIGIYPLTVVGTHVYWTFNFDIGGVWNSSVFGVTTSGNDFKLLTSTMSSFYGGVSTYNSSVLFANGGNDTLLSVPNTGGAAKILASGFEFRGVLVSDATAYCSAWTDIVSTNA